MKDTPARQILVPQKLEVFIYVLASIFVFAFINITPIISRTTSQTLESSVTREEYLGSLNFLTDVPFANTAVIVIFWSGVGLVAYTVAWAIINAVIEARNEIVVESEYMNKGKVGDRLKLPLIKSGLTLALFGWVVACAKLIVPMLLKNFRSTLLIASGVQLLKLVIPVVLLVACIALSLFLLRLVRNLPEIVDDFQHKPAA